MVVLSGIPWGFVDGTKLCGAKMIVLIGPEVDWLEQQRYITLMGKAFQAA